MDFIKSLRSCKNTYDIKNRTQRASNYKNNDEACSSANVTSNKIVSAFKCPTNKPSNSEKIKLQREHDRRNQRLNLINKCRINNIVSNQKTTTTTTMTTTTTTTCSTSTNNVAAVVEQQRCMKTGGVHSTGHKDDDAELLNSTYVVPELADRKKLLSLWQKERKEKLFQKQMQKPVFKVTHVDSKLFEIPKSFSMSSLVSFFLLLLTKSSYKFYHLLSNIFYKRK
jgi:hypothetical protein